MELPHSDSFLARAFAAPEPRSPTQGMLGRAFLLDHQYSGLGIICGRYIDECHVNIFPLGLPIFFKRLGNTLRDVFLLFSRAAFDPGDLYVRHRSLLHEKRREFYSVERKRRRKVPRTGL